jgi:predicted metal-dependent hydrolase
MTVPCRGSQILGKGSGMAGFRDVSFGLVRPRGESALAEIGRQAVALDLGAPVSVRVNPRARRVGLRIDAAERRVELVLPRGVPAELGLRFLRDKRGWIVARLDALPHPVPFAEGAVVPVLGMPHRIRRSLDPSAPPVTIADGEIRVRGDPLHLPRRVRDHLVSLAHGELARRARPLAARIGHKVARVGVRDTKSRWGSCSSSGNLSFSWRLIFAPDPVIDYVVAHEVAHLAEMNHGPRFWRLVESLAPGSAQPRAWLDRHRARLLSYG